MDERDKIEWLRDLRSLLMRNSHVQLYYTTNDDGVHVKYGPNAADVVNVGFSADSAMRALRAEMDAMTEQL